MECPYCHQEMEDGYLKAPGKAIIWTTKKHLNPLITTQEEIWLDSVSQIQVIVPHAYRCRTCKIIIKKYQEPVDKIGEMQKRLDAFSKTNK